MMNLPFYSSFVSHHRRKVTRTIDSGSGLWADASLPFQERHRTPWPRGESDSPRVEPDQECSMGKEDFADGSRELGGKSTVITFEIAFPKSLDPFPPSASLTNPADRQEPDQNVRPAITGTATIGIAFGPACLWDGLTEEHGAPRLPAQNAWPPIVDEPSRGFRGDLAERGNGVSSKPTRGRPGATRIAPGVESAGQSKELRQTSQI
jgi:hypothetical protein